MKKEYFYLNGFGILFYLIGILEHKMKEYKKILMSFQLITIQISWLIQEIEILK